MGTADAARYALIIAWSDEDHTYIATCPELPGCRTHADRRPEALARGEEALGERLAIARDRGWTIPAARPFDVWSNRPAIAPSRAPLISPV